MIVVAPGATSLVPRLHVFLSGSRNCVPTSCSMSVRLRPGPCQLTAHCRFFSVMLMPKLSIIMNDVSSLGFFVIASM